MLLTDDEIRKVFDDVQSATATAPWFIRYARAVEAAILEKLASSELPEPLVWDYYDFEGWRPRVMVDDDVCETYTADQLRQAYAQGAASQLAQEPDGYKLTTRNHGLDAETWDTTEMRDYKWDEDCIPLFTRKEPK